LERGGGGVGARLAATALRRLSRIPSDDEVAVYICGGGVERGCGAEVSVSAPQGAYVSMLGDGDMRLGVRGAMRPSSLRPRRPIRGRSETMGVSTERTRDAPAREGRCVGDPLRSIVAPPDGVLGAEESTVSSEI